LTTILAFPFLLLCSAIAAKSGDQWGEEVGALLYWFATLVHLRIDNLLALNDGFWVYPIAAFLAALFVFQSFRQFRQVQTGTSRFVLRSSIITAATVALVFCLGVLNAAATYARTALQNELTAILPRLPEPPEPPRLTIHER